MRPIEAKNTSEIKKKQTNAAIKLIWTNESIIIITLNAIWNHYTYHAGFMDAETDILEIFSVYGMFALTTNRTNDLLFHRYLSLLKFVSTELLEYQIRNERCVDDDNQSSVDFSDYIVARLAEHQSIGVRKCDNTNSPIFLNLSLCKCLLEFRFDNTFCMHRLDWDINK